MSMKELSLGVWTEGLRSDYFKFTVPKRNFLDTNYIITVDCSDPYTTIGVYNEENMGKPVTTSHCTSSFVTNLAEGSYRIYVGTSDPNFNIMISKESVWNRFLRWVGLAD